MNVRIEIDTRTFIRFWLVVIGFLLIMYAIYITRTALIIVCLSFFLAIALSPPVNYLVKTLPSKSRSLSTAIAYLAVLLILGMVIFLVVPPIVEQMTRFAQNVPTLVDSATEQYTGVDEIIDYYQLQPEVDKVVLSIKDGASQFASGIGSTLIAGIGSIFFTVVTTILLLVLTFLMLVEGPMWLNRIWLTYKDQDRMEHHRKLVHRMYKVVTGFIIGQFSVAAIAGLMAGVMVFILTLAFDVPANLVVPAVTIVTVLTLIPLFGAMIGGTLLSVVLALNDLSAAIVFLLFFILYQQVEANYISPKIQSKRIDLSALTILLSATIGFYLFGVIGGIISIPIAGCIGVLTEDYFTRVNKNNIKDKKLSNESVKEVQVQV
jgi:predicted PurR-regulated permease PerM